MASMPEVIVTYVGDVERLHLLPGDVGVISVPRPLTNEAAKRLRAMWEQTFPENKLLILVDGMKIGVVTRTADTGGEDGQDENSSAG